MVCKDCEKKLTKVICPDKWKDGASNTKIGKDRKLNENKLLSSKNKEKSMSPYERKCKICKAKLIQPKTHYCQGCAYKKGICSMCGKKIQDISNLKRSAK